MPINEYKKYIEDYFSEFNIEPFAVNIIESDDINQAFFRIRPDQIEESNNNEDGYHGFCVPPKKMSGKFTILLDKKYMTESKKEDYNWIGTVIHEITHVNDYIQFQKIINSSSYDELFDLNKYLVFSFWTEFHARAMGHHFIIKYRRMNNHEYAKEDHVWDIEFPQVIKWYNEYQSNTIHILLEALATLLGIVYAWELNYPTLFDQQVIYELFTENSLLEQIYTLLKRCATIDNAVQSFDELDELFKLLYPTMM